MQYQNYPVNSSGGNGFAFESQWQVVTLPNLPLMLLCFKETIFALVIRGTKINITMPSDTVFYCYVVSKFIFI